VEGDIMSERKPHYTSMYRIPFYLLTALLTAVAVFFGAHSALAAPPNGAAAVWKTRMPTLIPLTAGAKKSPSGSAGGIIAVAPAVKFSLLPYSSPTPVIITPTTSGPEAEEEITADPVNHQNLLSAISDFSYFQNITKYAYSTDDGVNWTDDFLPISGAGYLVTGDGQNWSANSDPTVASDKSGNVYLCNLYIALDANTGQALYIGLYVAHTMRSNGSVSFAQSGIQPVTKVDLTGASQPDKPWMTVDSAGKIYVTWSNFTSTTDSIMFASSSNQGTTWSKALRISTLAQGGRVQGSQVAVDSNGTVYVTYEVFCANFTKNGSCPSTNNARQQFIAKSTNGGATFTTPVAITPIFTELTFPSPYRTNSFPAIAVGPNHVAYVTYSAQSSTSSPAQVEFIHSGVSGTGTKNGFSAPVVVDNDANDDFFPSISVDANGLIYMSWFDGQAANPEFYSVAASYANAALQFATPLDVAGPIDAGTGFIYTAFIGDYAGIVGVANGKGEAHPVWTNGGLADFPLGPAQGFPPSGQLQTTTLTVP
jgi:hypothetical protein